MDKWFGKVAVVTGASCGIGAAITEILVESGLQVVGLARRKELVDELSLKLSNRKGKLYSYKVDLTIESEILEAFKWIKENIGPVNILINNAAIYKKIYLADGTSDDIKDILNTNIFGMCLSTREALKQMKECDYFGHVINISSELGHKVIGPMCGLYSATKHATLALTESLRQELQEYSKKIRVSCISPGIVDTQMVRVHFEDKNLLKAIPMLYCEDVAKCIIFVLSTPPHVQIHEIIVKAVGENF